MALISVIVPIYNVEKYLNRCIDSILNQSFTDFELILVDDGSTDESGRICDEYSNKDNRIIVIHKTNEGAGMARNTGLDWCFDNSDSKWIAFVDSDDWIHKNYFEIMTNAALKFNTDIVITKLEDTYEYIKDKTIAVSSKIISVDELHINNILATIQPPCKIIKKCLFKDIRFPDYKVCEDTFTIFKTILKCKKVAFIDNYIYYRYKRIGSLCHSENYDELLNVIKYFDNNLEYYKDKPDDVYAAVCLHYSKYCWKYYNIINSKKYKKQKKKFKRYSKKYLLQFHKKIKMPVFINNNIYNTSHLYETAYPHLMKVYWLYYGIRHKITSLIHK